MMKCRMTCWLSLGLSLLAGAGARADLTRTVQTVGVGEVSVVCAEPGDWQLAVSSEVRDGCDVVCVRLASSVEAAPPAFDVTFETGGADVLQVWTPYDERCQLWPQAWGRARYESALAFRAPLCAAFNNRDRNRCALAVSDAFHRLSYGLTVDERTCRIKGCVRFFRTKESPRKAYEVRLRIDRRDVFWGDAVREAADWVTRTAGLRPADVPEAAFDPLYSTWYAFWQDVHATDIEREARAAAELGMKTAILDDGWQKDKSRTYYSATGDWMPVASRFPDMRAHVEKVHAAGLKYMLWLSVPFVGDESKAYARFRGKYLRDNRDSHTAVLDPRFPEVREYLLATYERAVRDWGFDGLKLDFIDQFHLTSDDPAEKDGAAGRDYRSLPEATDRLMRDVVTRLKAIRPDVLLEFRQQYMGPAIRQYGNMIRATDCPADAAGNRRRIADLRLTSGTTAVHSDMLVWSVDETPENAARSVLSAIFGVVQYSMVLGRVPPAHREMMRHWIDFSTRHRTALLKGAFRPHHPEMQYPWIESWDDRERIVAAYVEDLALPVPADGRTALLINAAQASSLVVDLAAETAEAEAFDTFGKSVGKRTLAKGLQRVEVPPSGYLVIEGAPTEPLTVRRAKSGEAVSADELSVALGTVSDGVRSLKLTKRRAGDLSLAVEYAVAFPESVGPLVWHHDMRSSRQVSPSDGILRNASRQKTVGSEWLSFWPFAAVTGTNGTGRALALDPYYPAFYNLSLDARKRRLSLRLDVALTDESPTAEVRFAEYPIAGRSPFRQALTGYCRLYPNAFASRVREHGLWMPFSPISKVKGWEDFGFKFKEGGGEPEWDKAHGIHTFHYTEPTTWWQSVKGTNAYDLVSAGELVKKDRDPLAKAWAAGVFHDRDGKPVGFVKDTPWCKGVVWNLNDAPGIAGGTTGWQVKMSHAPRCEYFDSAEMYVTVPLDFNRAHFGGMKTPLCWDAETGRPAVFKGLIGFEYVREAAKKAHDAGFFTMANGTPAEWFWLAPFLDVLGTESDWQDWRNGKRVWTPPSDTELIYRRALCGKKPFCFLMNTDFLLFTPECVRKYFDRCLAYGAFPGFFSVDAASSPYFTRPELYERERPIYRKYLPIIRKLSEAGWTSDNRLLETSDARVISEQFGDRYVTLFNPLDRELELKVRFAGRSVRELLSGDEFAPDGWMTVRLPSETVRAYSVGGGLRRECR